MIEITNLQKTFGELEVLKDISLNIMDHEIYGLVGKSGAGKSTLLRCINGLETYSAGKLLVNGIEIKGLNKKELRLYRKNIGMIFQDFPMLSRKTVYENIAYPMKCWKYSKDDIEKRVKELAGIVDITDKLEQKPDTLSGGQKQRAAIARALSMNPEILLSDEATSALDPVTTKSILDLLKDINEKLGITIIMVTHQMEVVRSVCQKVSLLENGKIVESGDVQELFLKQPEAFRRFLGNEEITSLPEGVNIQIMLRKNDDSGKILSRIAKELQVEYTVCGGKMESYRGENLGDFIINIKNEDAPDVRKFLNHEHAVWHELSGRS